MEARVDNSLHNLINMVFHIDQGGREELKESVAYTVLVSNINIEVHHNNWEEGELSCRGVDDCSSMGEDCQ